MRMIRDERGGALLMVLMLLAVLSIVGILAFTLNTTANKQFDKKEANVQARHLAEMGVLHFKAEVNNQVLAFNSNPDNYMVYVLNEETNQLEVDEENSKKKYKTELCSLVSSFSPPGAAELEVGTYTLSNMGSSCGEDGITLSYRSQGNSHDGGDEVIEATIKIAPVDGGGGGRDEDDNLPPSGPPQKPGFSGGFVPTVNNLDEIKNIFSDEVKVRNGTSEQNPFNTNAAVEIINPVVMPKKVKWNFNNNLIISNDLTLNTGGNNNSNKGDAAILSIKKDLYIEKTLKLANHTTINVEGNFSVVGQSFFGTGAKLDIGGSAFFGGNIAELKNNADITVAKDAYFATNIGDRDNKPNFCVYGEAYLLKGGTWAPYLPEDLGYGEFDKSCFGISPGDSGPPSSGDYDWRVWPSVDADYDVGS